MRRDGDKPAREFTRSIDGAIHTVVNERLRQLGRGGYATVDRAYARRHLDQFIIAGNLTGVDVEHMVERASIEAATRYVEEVARERHWFLHTLASINEETIDSLALSRFIDEHKADQLAAEAQALGAIVTSYADSPGESDDSERWPHSDTLNERVYDALMAAGKRALADEFAATNGGDGDGI